MKKNNFKSISRVLVATILFAGLFYSANAAEAKTYKLVGESLSTISTTKSMSELITIQVPAQKISGADICLENEAMLRAKVVKVQEARRGKMEGYIDTILVAYSVPSEGNKAVDVSEKKLPMRVKLYSETDFKGLAESAATTVASHLLDVPFLSQGVAAVKGAVSPIEGESRIKSVGVSVYESTPLAYLSKGRELEAVPGTKLTLIFKIDEPDEPDEPKTEENTVQAQNLSESAE